MYSLTKHKSLLNDKWLMAGLMICQLGQPLCIYKKGIYHNKGLLLQFIFFTKKNSFCFFHLKPRMAS